MGGFKSIYFRETETKRRQSVGEQKKIPRDEIKLLGKVFNEIIASIGWEVCVFLWGSGVVPDFEMMNKLSSLSIRALAF